MLISLTVLGAQRVLAILGSVEQSLTDLTPFWREEFAPKYFAGIQDRFDLEGQTRTASGRFSSGRWAPLSPAYAAWKKLAFPGKGILERTGRLRNSMRWIGTTVGPEGVFDPQPTYVVVGTTVPYGVELTTGRSGPRPMPARPFVTPPDPAVFGPLLQKWVMRTAQGSAPP